MSKKTIYFDANGTTLMCQQAIKAHTEWLTCYNPSSDSRLSKPARRAIEDASEYMLENCGVSSATHVCLWTSGATESNCFIIKSCVTAYKRKLLEKSSLLKPHIICSSIEHHSSIECVKQLEELGEIDVSWIAPTIFGMVIPKDVSNAIRPNTCLITIMYANNEIPSCSDVASIGEIAKNRGIPFHSDCVQVFGKYAIDVKKCSIDALSASAHKFYGPKGVGILIINKKLIEGYHLHAELTGSQQFGLRGGTENVAGIVSTTVAHKVTMSKRNEKNEKLYKLSTYLKKKLSELYPIGDYTSYVKSPDAEREPFEVVFLGAEKKENSLCNTVLLSFAKNKGKPFCNVELKKKLDAGKCVVSIGSACLTSSDSASHVLKAIGAPSVIKRGTIRISFSDSNTTVEIDTFVKILTQSVEKQIK
jgi:cysteine desulfurase